MGAQKGPLWLRILARLVACLPFTTLGWLGAVLAFIAYDLLRIRRAQVLDAIARAGIHDGTTVARGMFRSLGQGALELLWVSARPDAPLAEHVRIDGWERYEAARALGLGVVVATAHTGNWDLTACACAARTDLTIITKRLHSPGLDAFWQSTRRARGLALVVSDEGVVPAIGACLGRGASVALLVDQDPERTTSVIDAEFLGQNALHDALPATIAARFGAPIVIAFARREGSHHVVSVIDVLMPPSRAPRTVDDRAPGSSVTRDSKTSATSAWIDEATRTIALHLDAFIRRDPSCWLWLHRRWKTQRGKRPIASIDPSDGERASRVVISAHPSPSRPTRRSPAR